MKKTAVLSILILSLTFACFLSSASADWTFSFADDRWSPVTNSYNNFNKVEFFVTTPNSSVWSGQGVSNFSDPSWSATKINSTYVRATGNPATAPISWDLKFTGTAPATFTFDYVVYAGGNAVAAYHMITHSGTWNSGQDTGGNGGGWSPVTNLQQLPPYNRTQAPIPGTLLLLGSGLLGFVAIRRKTVSK